MARFSRTAALRSGPASMGRKPAWRATSATAALAVGSSPASMTSTPPSMPWGWAWNSAPKVLKPLMILAPGRAWARAAERDPSGGGTHTGPPSQRMGLLQSTRMRPLRSPRARAASTATLPGTARKVSSAAAAASAGEAAVAPGQVARSSATSLPGRTPKQTEKPAPLRVRPRAEPTLPVPMIAIFKAFPPPPAGRTRPACCARRRACGSCAGGRRETTPPRP
jgi:hypothetical protein